MKFSKLIFTFILGSTILIANSQDPLRFQKAIDNISQKEYCISANDKIVVFAGSSSIVAWKDVQDYFPDVVALNNGFGGSHFSDLLHYYQEAILDFNPDQVFIYEGDNDIGSKKEPRAILETAKTLVAKLQEADPDLKIVFISPKPSLARWHLKDNYLELIGLLHKFADQDENIELANVWSAMLKDDGNVMDDIFVQDGLHMNKKGYDIWYSVLKDFME